jgi:sialate O-acetylesterase
MIAPLGSYGLRGVLWYQGESNTDDADQYRALLTGLMRDWRRQFSSALPFLIVQLPNFGAPNLAPAESGWATLREAQRRAVIGDGNAALAVTIDIGDPRNLHPPDKQQVGARLARAARHVVYGEAVSAWGAVPRRAQRNGDQVIVDFDSVEGSLLTYSSLRPTGFELCAAAQGACRFVDAAVQGHSIVLDASGIPANRVRFCWGDAPICNLYDSSGLPVGPFEFPIT